MSEEITVLKRNPSMSLATLSRVLWVQRRRSRSCLLVREEEASRGGGRRITSQARRSQRKVPERPLVFQGVDISKSLMNIS